MINRIITALCFAVMLVEVLVVIIKFARRFKDRTKFIAYLRSFNQGKCALIYVTAYPLYIIGALSSGTDPFNAVFGSISKIINLVVLQYDTSSISVLLENDGFYRFTVYFCFVLATLNALMFSISLVHQYVWNFIQSICALFTKKDKLYIFGNNENSESIYLSDKSKSKVIIGNVSKEEGQKLFSEGIAYISVKSYENAVRDLFKLVNKFDRKYTLVINTENDDENIRIGRMVVSHIEGSNAEAKRKLFNNLNVFVFGDPKYHTVYNKIVSDGEGCISYINKYQKIAIDFVDKYPFSSFMSDTHIDYATSLVKEDVEINALLIGFGRVNRQIFLTSVANNQFMTRGDDTPELKKVNYHIFDKEDSTNNKNLNHSYYRFENESKGFNKDEYLPLPSVPANDELHKLDINDHQFYTEIEQIITRSKNDVNFAIIAFGSDLENIDMAQKLIEKRREWGAESLVIFVKASKWHKEQTMQDEYNCFYFANEEDIVYNIDKICNDDLINMAHMRDEIYELEGKMIDLIKNNKAAELDESYLNKVHSSVKFNWYAKSHWERESSIYSCLSIRSKLNLMGLDCCRVEENDDRGLTEEEYFAIYAGNDMPNTSKYNARVNGKLIISYPTEFNRSRRGDMAIHEHQRWNSFMISKGMIPSSKAQIIGEKKQNPDGSFSFTKGKNYFMRRHGNITTFEGLIEFRDLIVKHHNKTVEQADVIKYDYQILDDAYWLLSKNGYKIILKKERAHVMGVNKIYFRTEEKWENASAVLLSKDEKDSLRVDATNLDALNNFCVDFDTNKYDHLYFENKDGVKTSKVYPGNSSIGVEYKLSANGNVLTHIFTRDIDESTGRVDNFELRDEKNLAYREDKSKKISVFVPSTYDGSEKADVLYFFDAQNLFCKAGKYTENGDPYGSWQLDVALKNLYKERGKNVIVVGIDNSDKYRSNELFMDHKKFGELSMLAKYIEEDNFSVGYLDGLSDFMVNTLHPFIKRKYNIKEDNIGIGGSSMGGIASFYCSLHKMGFYKYVLSYSPAYGLYEMSAFENYFKGLDFEGNKDKLPAIHIYCGEGDMLEKQLVVSSREMKNTLVDHGYPSSIIFETYDIEKPHNEESWRLILPQSFKYLYQ